MKKLLWSLLFVCLELSLAQPTITSVQFLSDLLGVDNPRSPLLSPDGNTIFYQQDNTLCFFVIDAETTQCYEYTETFGGFGRYSSPLWSPDSSRVLFTESFFDMFRESDLWQLDAKTGEYINLTDDGIDKLRLGDEDPNALIDYLPTFSPTGELYFFRSRFTRGINEVLGEQFSLELFNLTETLQGVRVSSLRPQLPIYSVFRPAAISPDGKGIAFIVLPNDWRENKATGVWVQQLETGQREHIATLSDFPDMRPDWATERDSSPLIPMQLEWLDTEHLLVYFPNNTSRLIGLGNVFVIGVSMLSVTALFDFRAVGKSQNAEDADKLKESLPESGFALDGQLIYASYPTSQGQLSFWSRDHLKTEKAKLLISTDYFLLGGYTLPTVSNDGKRALIAGNLLTLE